MRLPFLVTSPLWICLASACTASEGTAETREENTASRTQPEEWASNDDPRLFKTNLERRAAALPRSGTADPAPWAGSYWPTWLDSINQRWDGPDSTSPAKKYERAFGLQGVEDKVSKDHGIDAFPDARACSSKSQCPTGELCAKRSGASSGRCIAKWYGICHGWAAAAILFPAPQHAVVVNGVTFKVQDIKALASLVHDTTEARFLAARCDENSADGGVTYDEHGRPPAACRDTNAGTFHVVLANFLGLQKRAFIEDRTFDQQVWNHPIRAYEILEQRTVSPEEANRLIEDEPPAANGAADADDHGYLFNERAASLTYVKNEVSFITESPAANDGPLSPDTYTRADTYEYILELDAQGLVIGGEWVGRNRRNHPDFLWLPSHAGSASVALGAISYDKVEALVKASVSK